MKVAAIALIRFVHYWRSLDQLRFPIHRQDAWRPDSLEAFFPRHANSEKQVSQESRFD